MSKIIKTIPLYIASDIIPGFAFKSDDFGDSGCFVVKIKDIQPPIVNIKSCEKVNIDKYSEEKLKKFLLKKGDFVVAMTGATIGKVGKNLSNERIFVNQRVAKFQPKSKYDKYFIYYCLVQDCFIKFVLNHLDSSSAQGNISGDGIGQFLIPDFEFQDQQKIASILSNLDAKIELNNKINSELEAMAKTLYDYWFVQFDFPDENGKPYKTSGGKMVWSKELKIEIPGGWEVMKLKSIFEFEKGIEPGSSEYLGFIKNKDCVKFFRVGDIDGESSVYINSSYKKYILAKERDIIVTFDGSVGKLGFGLNGAFSSGLRKIYSKLKKFDNSLVYFIFRDKKIIATIHKYATGSIILHASSSIDHLEVPFGEVIYLKFQEISKPIFDQMVKNKQENQKLSELRDFLLPMLMNGQIVINEK